MSNIKTNKRGDVETLSMEGELTIQHADELRTSLINSLNKANHVRLDLEKVTEADISCLQLLYSAHLESTKTNKSITIDNCSEPFKQAVIDSGFSYVRGCVLECQDNCFNTKGGLG